MDHDDSSRPDQTESRRAMRPTFGELRRQLAENGDPWTIDPLISDDEPLPEYPLGGMPEDAGERMPSALIDPQVDVRTIIAELPPNDPGLRERWAEVGVPLDGVPPEATSDRPDDSGNR
jgi:hypothetical protein